MKAKSLINSLLTGNWIILVLLLFSLGCNKMQDRQEPVGEEHTHTSQDHTDHQAQSNETSMHDDVHIDHQPTDESEQSNLEQVVSSPNNWVISNQPTVELQLSDSTLSIPAQGYITYDTRRNNKVAARVGGRIEKLYIKYNYAYIRKGDKIMDIYSPELNTYQNEYLHLIASSQKEDKLVEEAKKKLKLLGLTDAQIRRLENTGEHSYTVSMYSAYSGYIIFSVQDKENDQMSTVPKGEDAMREMGNAKAATSYANSSNLLREGMYVTAGQTLFSVNDLDEVWAIVSLEARFEPHLKVNDNFIFKSELAADKEFEGKVNFIEPVFEKEQRFLQARVYLSNNDHFLKINSLVSGTIIPAGHTMWVLPTSSIYDLGRRKIVWIYRGNTKRGSKYFEAREVITGIPQKGFTQIIGGVDKSEAVALDAGYMVDSEGFILPESVKK